MNGLVRLGVLAIVSTTAACASAGRSYQFSEVRTLELGSARSALSVDLEEAISRVEARTPEGWEFEQITFFEQSGSRTWRSSILEYRDDRLNGYSHLSSFEDDKTKASLTVRPGIGAKLEEVIGMLGRPHMRFRCPTSHSKMSDACEKYSLRELLAWYDVQSVTATVFTLGIDSSDTVVWLFERSMPL